MSKSLLGFTGNCVVLDIETTGLSPVKNEIIEFAAVRVRNYEVTQEFATLIKPSVPIPAFITGLTGISDLDVENAPDIVEILPQIRDFIGDDIVVGHNVKFDISFIRANFNAVLGAGFYNDFIDTMRLSRRLFPDMEHHRLSDLETEFGLHNERAHRALSDVYLTLDAYKYMKNYYKGVKSNGNINESC